MRCDVIQHIVGRVTDDLTTPVRWNGQPPHSPAEMPTETRSGFEHGTEPRLVGHHPVVRRRDLREWERLGLRCDVAERTELETVL